ncbi:MAG: glycosyltransferase family 2 protein [Kiritimatiellae bacterium]|nr:glycosyltransferase family 2 protein [Kiritimatiellia bacterium]
MSPAVSVVIPTFNCARFLGEAVESALRQTFEDCEVVVVDDGSTDETPSVLAGFGSRIRVIRQKNLGAAAARNTGIRETHGPFLAFLDADDRWKPEKLRRQMEVLEREQDFPIVHTDSSVIDEQGRIITPSANQQRQSHSGMVFEEFFVNPVSVVLTSSVVVARKCLDAVGGFDTHFPILQDLHLFLRLAMKYSIFYIPEPLVEYRMRRGSLTRSNVVQNILEHERIITTIVEQYPDYFRSRCDLVRRAWLNHHFHSARALFHHGAIRESRPHFYKSLFRRPTALLYLLATFFLRRVPKPGSRNHAE